MVGAWRSLGFPGQHWGRATLGLGLGNAGEAMRWMRGVTLSERRRVRKSFPQKPGPVAGLPPAPPIGAETFPKLLAREGWVILEGAAVGFLKAEAN